MSDLCNKCSVNIEDKKVGAKCSECGCAYHLGCCSIKTAEAWRKRGAKPTWRCDSCALDSSSQDSKGSDNVAGVLQKLREDIAKNMNETRMRFDGIDSRIDSLRSSIEESQTRITNLETENVKLREMCEQSKEENLKIKEEFNKLKTEVIELQQYSRRHNIEIKGIPATHDEDPYAVLQCVARALGVPWNRQDFSVAHRIQFPRHGGQPPIIAAFISRSVRATWLSAARERRIKASDISPRFDPEPVYIFAHLTVYNKQLLYRARQLVQERKLANAWTIDGKVWVRKNSADGRSVRIIRMEDLDSLVG